MNTQDYQKDIPVAMLLVCFLQFFNFNRFTPLPDSTENRDTAGELIIHWDEGQNESLWFMKHGHHATDTRKSLKI